MARTICAVDGLECRVLFSSPAYYTMSTPATFAPMPDGVMPQGGVVMDASGNLYGTTTNGNAVNGGCGTVFELDKGAGRITTVAALDYGGYPVGGVTFDTSGDLFGTTSSGGASSDGTVFEVVSGSGSAMTLASFNGANGASPDDTPVLDAAGNLFGTTSEGGNLALNDGHGDGTVFEIAKGTGAITTLAVFNGTNGADPVAGLAMDTASGNLYGTTEFGGDLSLNLGQGCGTLFEIADGSSTLTTLYSFSGTDGQCPATALTIDTGGNLYGTTSAGTGAVADGTVFKIASSDIGRHVLTWSISFSASNGTDPQSPLLVDDKGNIFGTTEYGGLYDDGAIFEVGSGTGAINSIASFDRNTDGLEPMGSIAVDGSGNLYGATLGGWGDSAGTLFEVAGAADGTGTITTLPITTLATMTYDGSTPSGAIALDTAGNLYGTSEDGYENADGTVFEVTAGATTASTAAWFDDAVKDHYPASILVRDPSGNLFGTVGGGTYGCGAVIEVAAGTGVVTTLASFNGFNGAGPDTLAQDSNGNLFGTTEYGGPGFDPNQTEVNTGYGTVFEVARNSGAITSLATFDNGNGNTSTGAEPEGALAMDTSGNLYGTTYTGGANDEGTVFEVARGTRAITTLVSFDSANTGAGPTSGVVLALDTSGNLFGTASYGGANSEGTVFEVTRAGGDNLTVLASFNDALGTGTDPEGALAIDTSGNLYGTAKGGGGAGLGTIFEYNAGNATLDPLAAFDGGNGENPGTGVTLGAGGNLYGTTGTGGANGDGAVFECQSGNDVIAPLVSFNTTNGATPAATVVIDSGGNLYGTTEAGGTDGDGTVFEIASGALTTLASFSTGVGPYGGVVLGPGNNFYGTTSEGGVYNDGTVFEIADGSTAITTIASFNGADGVVGPRAYNYGVTLNGGQLLFDSSGDIYGTTCYGGDGFDPNSPRSGYGTVFEIAYGGSAITTLAFLDQTDGANPIAGMAFDSSGHLYGTASAGGADGDGTVFEVARSNGQWGITQYTSFNGADGAYPIGGLVLNAAGNFYGTAAAGGDAQLRNDPWGSGYGTVFEYYTGNNTLSMIAAFNGADGMSPEGTLVLDSNGNLFGTASLGGYYGYGTAFEVTSVETQNATIKPIGVFDFANGTNPCSGLLMDTNGNLYGTTALGGDFSNSGSAFELSPCSETEVLNVRGTAGDDGISVEAYDGGNGLVVTVNGVGEEMIPAPSGALPSAIEVNGGAGNDTITVGAGVPQTTVVGDSGVDTIVADGDSASFTDTLTASADATAGLTVQGTGTLALLGSNTYGGITEIDSGATLEDGSGSLPYGGNVLNNGTLEIDATDQIGKITGGGSLIIEASSLLQLVENSTQSTTSVVGSLTIDSAGTLDITDNTLRIDETNVSLSQVETWVLNAMSNNENGGSAPSITSSMVYGPNSQPSRGLGYGDSSEDPLTVPNGYVEVKYVPMGDVDLSGRVNITDYTRVINNLGRSSGMDYSAGDVNGDGSVNIYDLTIVLNDYGGHLNSNGT
jgi:uncharacterized repeat protein (TIGR03803 family)